MCHRVLSLRCGLIASAVLVVPLVTQNACVESPTCADLFAERQFTTAVQVCTVQFEAQGIIGDAIRTTRAYAALKNDKKVIQWADRIGNKKGAAAIWRAAAKSQQRLGNPSAALRARAVARDLWIAQGKNGEASYEAYRISKIHRLRSELLKALTAATQSHQLAITSNDKEMKLFSLTTLLTASDEIGDLNAVTYYLTHASEFIDTRDPTAQFYLAFHQGQSFYAHKRFSLARASYIQALKLKQHAIGEENIRAAHFNIVDTCLETHDCNALAESHLNIISNLIENQSKNNAVIALHYYRARMALEKGQLEIARRHLDVAFAAQPIDDWRWRLETAAGRVLERSGEIIEAKAAYQRAVDSIEKLREEVVYDDLKTFILERKREPYERLFALAASEGHEREALNVSERARARTFLDAFYAASRGAEIIPDVAPAGLASLIPSLSHSPLTSPKNATEILSDVRSSITVAYFVAADDVWVQVISTGSSTLVKLKSSSQEIRSAIESFDADRDDVVANRKLAKMLFERPVQNAIRGAGTIEIITDGIIGRVPFAALLIGREYLISNHLISYVPSLSAAMAIRGRRVSGTEAPIVIGASTGAETSLPGAEAEAHMVAQMLGVQANIGGEATREKLWQASKSSLLHVAAHSGFSFQGAWLALTDGRVFANQIVNRRLGPAIVVLASCESAARHGRGLWGALGAAFLAAGSAYVVANMWPVSDAGNIALMRRFYAIGKTTKGEMTPLEMLTLFQREMLAKNRPPSEWAGLVVLGVQRRVTGKPTYRHNASGNKR